LKTGFVRGKFDTKEKLQTITNGSTAASGSGVRVFFDMGRLLFCETVKPKRPVRIVFDVSVGVTFVRGRREDAPHNVVVAYSESDRVTGNDDV